MSHPSHDLGRDIGMAFAKATPPVTISALTLNEWAAIATFVYVVLQTAYLVWKWRREWRKPALPPPGRTPQDE